MGSGFRFSFGFQINFNLKEIFWIFGKLFFFNSWDRISGKIMGLLGISIFWYFFLGFRDISVFQYFFGFLSISSVFWVINTQTISDPLCIQKLEVVELWFRTNPDTK